MSNVPHELSQRVARILLRINALIYSPKNPFTFRTGVISPIYIDNRLILSHPDAWKEIMQCFVEVIDSNEITYDMIAGLETTGMNFSTTLGFILKKPTIFVRKGPREYGTRSRIEGGSPRGKTVLLIQDTITTGNSMMEMAQILRDAEAKVTDCIIIDGMDFVEAELNFQKHNVNMYQLTTFPIIIKEALKLQMFSEQERAIIEDWYADPHGWKKKQGIC